MKEPQQPKIVDIPPMKLVGMNIHTTLAEGKVPDLWKKFAPRVGEITNRKGAHFLSVQKYNEDLPFEEFDQFTRYQTWAAVQVTQHSSPPDEMINHFIEGGKYAMFLHYGARTEFHKTAAYIFGQWLPTSGFKLDNRHHFEWLDERYIGPMDPQSIEEVWIPITT